MALPLIPVMTSLPAPPVYVTPNATAALKLTVLFCVALPVMVAAAAKAGVVQSKSANSEELAVIAVTPVRPLALTDVINVALGVAKCKPALPEIVKVFSAVSVSDSVWKVAALDESVDVMATVSMPLAVNVFVRVLVASKPTVPVSVKANESEVPVASSKL